MAKTHSLYLMTDTVPTAVSYTHLDVYKRQIKQISILFVHLTVSPVSQHNKQLFKTHNERRERAYTTAGSR